MTAPAEAIMIVLVRTEEDILNVLKYASKLIAHEAALVVNAYSLTKAG